MINGIGVVGFRDPNGIRPLILGSKENDLLGPDYVLASESTVLDVLGFDVVDDVKPGEAIFLDEAGNMKREECSPRSTHTPCIFEYVYLARPDAKIDEISVHKSRMRMGDFLAQKIKKTFSNLDIDVVIPIPDSSTTSALQLTISLGKEYRQGFVKNRYVGRTFIMPYQEKREKSVRQKLNPIDFEFQGKNVLLVDDSIVRGTTSRQIIQMARQAGAEKVYFASASPAIRYQNVYGIDMAATTELVAHNRSKEEIRDFIGADELIYQDLEDLIEAVKYGNPNIEEFECSVFNGEYVTSDIDQIYLKKLEENRSDSKKVKS